MLKILKSGQQQQFLQAEIREEENVVLDDGIFFLANSKVFHLQLLFSNCQEKLISLKLDFLSEAGKFSSTT